VASPGFGARRGTCESYCFFHRRQLLAYSRCQTLYRSQCTGKKLNCCKSRGHVPQCPLAGDATGPVYPHSCKAIRYLSVSLLYTARMKADLRQMLTAISVGHAFALSCQLSRTDKPVVTTRCVTRPGPQCVHNVIVVYRSIHMLGIRYRAGGVRYGVTL